MTHPNGLNNRWTPAAIETIITLTIAGKTKSEISQAIWERHHISFTSNAIAGKQHRLDVSNKRPTKIERKSQYWGDKKIHKRINFDSPDWDQQEQAPLKLTLLDLEAGQCRWPLSEKRDGMTLFCGQPAGERDYCLEHCRRK